MVSSVMGVEVITEIVVVMFNSFKLNPTNSTVDKNKKGI